MILTTMIVIANVLLVIIAALIFAVFMVYIQTKFGGPIAGFIGSFLIGVAIRWALDVSGLW